ncbi:MAG TPA: 4Fe-4S dicluster domain-containing protein, partial [Phycisphaerae bacterium]|nr:4Fe-4S dicluster domain-containing protein [Phycisphaerae bacterium]
DAAGPDLSVRFHQQRAGTPVGPAAGPHTQMAQNLLLSWLAGGRIMELKTVQINDRLKIGRPCIDATNIGYNIEWSQELRIEEAIREYVKGAMLIHMHALGGLLDGPITTHATETIYDMSVGYDLAGISSAPVRSFIERMKDARQIVDELRGEIPGNLKELRDLDYPTRLSSGITLSTFHGCPADEIEKICRFLLTEMDCDVIVKMNPPMLGRERLEHLLHDVLGYREISVQPHAYSSGLQFTEGVEICKRLAVLAESRSRGFGVKFSNTLEVVNHRDFFTPDNKTQYLSGQPLHVITLALADEFRKAIGPQMPFTFSAGVDRQNFVNMVACGFCPITVCTDLLRPGGYGRLPAYLTTLAAEMKRIAARGIDDFIRRARPSASTAAQNLSIMATETRNDPRYRAEVNRKVPNRIESQLDTFDCITCDKCLPVCPNAANFLFTTDPHRLKFHDWVVNGQGLKPGSSHEIVVEKDAQIANFADFCNDCGNCDTFCPEYGGPFIRKPNFFGSYQSWAAFPSRDGFFLDFGECVQMHGRIKGRHYYLAEEIGWRGYRFEDGTVCLFLRAGDHAVERWFAFGPKDAGGHIIDMHAYHTMRILMTSVLRGDRAHQVNVRAICANGG